MKIISWGIFKEKQITCDSCKSILSIEPSDLCFDHIKQGCRTVFVQGSVICPICKNRIILDNLSKD